MSCAGVGTKVLSCLKLHGPTSSAISESILEAICKLAADAGNSARIVEAHGCDGEDIINACSLIAPCMERV